MGVLRNLFGSGKIVRAIEAGGTEYEETKLNLYQTAIQSAVGIIGASLSQCVFRTFRDGKEIDEKESYLWNVEPNPGQTSTKFLIQLTEELIYNGGCLIVDEGTASKSRLYLAGTFTETRKGTSPAIYSGITINGELPKRGNTRFEKDVMHLSVWSNNVTSMLEEVCDGYMKLIDQAAVGYAKNYSEKGILTIGNVKRGNQEYEKMRDEALQKNFKKFFSSESAVLPLYDGYSYVPQTTTKRNTSEVNDIKILADEVYNRVGQVFQIPPALLKGEVAAAEKLMDMALIYAVKPLCCMLEEEIIRKRYGYEEKKKGNYIMVDPSMVNVAGIFSVMDKVDKSFADGIYSIDEIRRKFGEPELGTPEAQEHYITKNYQSVKGGEGNA